MFTSISVLYKCFLLTYLLTYTVKYASSAINHAVISFVYTAIGYACSDFILMYTTVGYTNNIYLGCNTIGKIEISFGLYCCIVTRNRTPC